MAGLIALWMYFGVWSKVVDWIEMALVAILVPAREDTSPDDQFSESTNTQLWRYYWFR